MSRAIPALALLAVFELASLESKLRPPSSELEAGFHPNTDNDYPRPADNHVPASPSSPQRLAQRKSTFAGRPDVSSFPRNAFRRGDQLRPINFSACRFADQSKVFNGAIKTRAIALALPQDASDVSK